MTKVQALAAALIIFADYLRNQKRLEEFEITPIAETIELMAHEIGKEVSGK